jgi:DNA-binding beta-propeller fold protein YncE
MRHLGISADGRGDEAARPLYGASWAVVVGISAYSWPHPPLLNARRDAEAVATLLREEYRFEQVVTLYDEQATHDAILFWLRDELRLKTTADDRVLFYFAGHGTTLAPDEPSRRRGYLIPYGAGDRTASYIRMEELRDACGDIRAKHILLILDCCFSGILTVMGRATGVRDAPSDTAYLRRLTARRSWQVLTAGTSDEPVADSGVRREHSPFTGVLLGGLRGDAYREGTDWLTASMLAEYVKPKVVAETSRPGVRGQEPLFAPLVGSDLGEFVFVRPERVEPLLLPPDDTSRPPTETKGARSGRVVAPKWRVALLGGLGLIILLCVVLPLLTTPFIENRRAPGRFWQPDGIAVDSGGNIYVAEGNNYRIQKLDAGGQPLAQWGSSSSRESAVEFSSPSGVALDSQGYIYVTDTLRDRVQKLGPDGWPLGQWGSRGSAPGQFIGPHGIAADDDGHIYVADTSNHRIQKLDAATGRPLAQWGGQGSDPGQFNSPRGVALDRQGNIYVADTENHRIQKLDAAGRPLGQWGGQSNDPLEMYQPYSVTVDGHGNMYVAEPYRNRIQKIGPDGVPLTKWTSPSPYGVAVDGQGNIYLTDTRNDRIKKLDPSGRLVFSAGG